jgi:Right handed beta helix region/Pectate lyase superfamily protein
MEKLTNKAHGRAYGAGRGAAPGRAARATGLAAVLALGCALGLAQDEAATAAAPATALAVAEGASSAPDTADCRAPAAWPQPPREAVDVTRFGARPDDDLADDAAIHRALASLQPGDWLVFPPGRYLQRHSLWVDVPGVTLWGAGAQLHALDAADQTVALVADRVQLLGFELTATTRERRSEPRTARISIGSAAAIGRPAAGRAAAAPVRGVRVQGNRIVPDPVRGHRGAASSAGILVIGAQDFTVAGNTVQGTLADGIHLTGGSRHGRVLGNRVEATGDDGIAAVSYLVAADMARLRAGQAPSDSAQVQDVLIDGNDVGGNAWGRGIAVVGSRRITVSHNRVHDVARAAGILVAQEGGWQTGGAREVRVEANQLQRIQRAGLGLFSAPRTGHGAIELHAIDNDRAGLPRSARLEHLAVRDVLLRDNDIDDAATDGIRIGRHTEPGGVRGVQLVGNRVRDVGGRPLTVDLADAISAACPADPSDPSGTSTSTDTAMAADATCTRAAAAPPTGARLRCERLP